jgi:hypothetical protein
VYAERSHWKLRDKEQEGVEEEEDQAKGRDEQEIET